MTRRNAFDPIAMEVFSMRLLAITEDMGMDLIRSSFSPNIKERRDCSVGLFDGRGRLISQAAHMPLHLGSLLGGVEAVLREIPADDIADGDAFICNDPFLAGGTHLPDVTIVTPIYEAGRIVAWAANIGHHSDFGGRVPGSIAGDSGTVYEEGLRLPIIHIVRKGKLDERLLHLIAHNTREPVERTLDLKAQIATNEGGRHAFLALVNEMGREAVESAVDDLLDYTARRLQNRIAKLKPGRYSFTTLLDDDGTNVKNVPLVANIEVSGGRLRFDFTGTGPQAKGAVNVAESALQATVYYCVKALLDPGLLPNSGMFDGIEIHCPPGTILSPRSPAATGARATTTNRAAGAIFGAFRQLLPIEDVQASSNDSIPAYTFSGPSAKSDGTYVYLETLGGGIGARHDSDGMDASHVHLSNSSNLPAEALENEYELLVDEYALVPDSGGAGRHRGGLSFVRQLTAMQDDTFFSSRSDGHVNAPQGAFGGLDGGTARIVFNPGKADERELPTKTTKLMLKKGDSVRIQTCGGAGMGNPAERDAAALAEDLRAGKVSAERAHRDYGSDLTSRAEAMR